jgi:hypothetical protein
MAHVPPDLPEASTMIIAETERDIVVAVQISKSTVLRHMRFLENLVNAGTRAPDEEPPPR